MAQEEGPLDMKEKSLLAVLRRREAAGCSHPVALEETRTAMHAQRGRFLIPLILLLVAALCCSWGAAHARTSFGSSPDARYVIGSKSGARPLSVSGEPDVPQLKLPPPHGALERDPSSDFASASRVSSYADRLLWMIRFWVARYWGAR